MTVGSKNRVADTLVLVAAAFVLCAGIKGAGHSVLHTRFAISVSEGGVPPPGGGSAPVAVNTIPILRSNLGRLIQKAAEPLQSYVRFV